MLFFPETSSKSTPKMDAWNSIGYQLAVIVSGRVGNEVFFLEDV